jgi:hypothetical protein
VRLLYETLGILAVTVVVARVFVVNGVRARYSVACIAVAAALTSVLALTTITDQFAVLKEQRTNFKTARAVGFDEHAAENRVGDNIGVSAAFTDWARQRIPGHDTYYLVMNKDAGYGALPHWLTWALLPHVATAIEGQQGNGKALPPSVGAARKADWVIFYGVNPRRWALRREVPVEIQGYAQGLAIARRR